MMLYIDPGTGSMLFTVLIGIIGAAVYSVKTFWMKLKFVLSGGKAEKNKDKIPFVIFSDDKRYWSVFEPICREMDQREIDVVYMTASPNDPALNNSYDHIKAEFIGEGNKAFAKLNFLNASVVLSTTPGLDVYQWKRSKDVDYYVHMLHQPNEVTRYRMFGVDYYDALMLSGEHQVRDIRALEQKRNLPAKDIIKIGIPYMDEMAARLKAAPPVPLHPRTVLLAPTWGPNAMFSIYGGALIEELLKTGYHIIVRPHPQSFISEKKLMDQLMQQYPESAQLEWNRDNDNFEVLRRSDILISDFSGVVFDFALVYDKPVIYTDPQFDLGPYDAWWLDTPLWTLSALPRIGRELTEKDMGNLKALIDSCIKDEKYAAGRQSVKAETWEHTGYAAERAIDFLLRKYDEVTAEKEDE
ncbi:MAG: CDP-glycerol glycerophosphotransferase family protein [Peptococcaceae bacterium]|nr:CDP-glycerol glycerophosphotransferase family protein [Peptococcaceae bacterium]